MNRGLDDGTVASGHGILDEVDAAILRRLRQVAEVRDPVPDDLVERAQFAVAWDEVEAELAELTSVGALAGIRGDDAEVRSLTFSAEYASMTVMIERQRATRRIDGWLADVPEPAVVRLRRLGDSQDAAVSDEGRFEFLDVPPGPVQLLVLDAHDDTARLVTPTIDI